MIYDSFQLSNVLLTNLNLINQVYTTKCIKEHLILKFSKNKTDIILPNNLKTILGFSKEIKSVNIKTLLMLIELHHTIPIIRPTCMFLEYNQEPEFVYNII